MEKISSINSTACWTVRGAIDAGEGVMFEWTTKECMPALFCGRAKVWAKSELRHGDTAVIKGNMAELHRRGRNWPAIKEGGTERHEVESVEIPLQTALRYRPPHGTVKEWAESLRLNMPAIAEAEAEEPLYHKSASTAKCLGGPVPPKKEIKMPEQKKGPKPGPKLEWDVGITPYAISVRLLADATTVGMEERIRLFRFTDKLLIRSMKRCLLKQYNLARQESGPVTK